MASSIFNNLLQSPLKSIARGTQNFLGDQGPLPLQFGLQILERTMRSSAGIALEDEPHRKVQRIQVRAPWGPVFLADERRDVGLNPPLGHSWAMWGRRVLLEGLRCSLEVLSSPWQQFTFQNVRDVPLAVQCHSWEHETRGDISVAVTAAQTTTEVKFWRRLTLLLSTDAFLPQTRSFWW